MAKLSKMNKNGTVGLNIPSNKVGSFKAGDDVELDLLSADCLLVKRANTKKISIDAAVVEIEKLLFLMNNDVYKQVGDATDSVLADTQARETLKFKLSRIFTQL